ncbi:MAG TPA: hypothetical protein VMV19_11935 [Xanthobacteraceae bacterium]|nr:hypothetical protein [Xanthobacteraceae bacterium]
MITPETISEMLGRVVVATQVEDGVRISTHVLYPSNGTVNVVVRGGTDSFVISDEGGAISEMISTGIRTFVADRALRVHVKNHGLLVQDGVIFSPKVPLDAIPAAILLVANASRDVASWAIGHLRAFPPRNFRNDLAMLLSRHFHDNLKHDTPIIGASNKPHKFTYVVYLHGDRKLLIDPVVPDASSINARVVANLDVRMANDPLISQIIIYDDAFKWRASDLKLLEIGAPTVPFSYAEAEITKRAA